jgi:YHS domain-containing protein
VLLPRPRHHKDKGVISASLGVTPSLSARKDIMRIDPVCGMEVDETKVPQNLSSEHLGHYFYFCSQECKEEFERNPQQYVSPPAA